MTFGQRLEMLREERNLSQVAVSKMLNIANSTLSLYESDYRKPDYDMLIKLAKFYDVSTDYLLGLSKERKLPARQDRKIHLLDVTGVPEEAIKLIDEYAQFIKDKYTSYKDSRKRQPEK